MNAVEISRTGLDVEWQRLQVIAENIANMNTTRTASGDPYRPLRLLSGPKGDFAAALNAQGGAQALDGVQVMGIEPISNGIRRVYDPSHPHANADGFVSYPNVDHAGEMTLMIKTSRAYEANLKAMTIAEQMYEHALELGK